MKCPRTDQLGQRCNGKTVVILTRHMLNPSHGTVRRRCCQRCDHRFYAHQAPEVALPSWAVHWPHDNHPAINWTAVAQAESRLSGG
jgi:hypothetical protein